MPKEKPNSPQDDKLTVTQTFSATEGQEKTAKPWGLGLCSFVFVFNTMTH